MLLMAIANATSLPSRGDERLGVTDSNSSAYYRTREQREHTLAETSADPAIARIHLDMAERYAQLLLEPAR